MGMKLRQLIWCPNNPQRMTKGGIRAQLRGEEACTVLGGFVEGAGI
jgi:hypothetical protein